MASISKISSLDAILCDYDVVLCDVWGVLHNGMQAWPGAISALRNARAQGVCVIMITNAPRPWEQVLKFFKKLDVPDSVCDGIITSGDVTRQLIENAGIVSHLGPDKDDSLYDGLSASRTQDLAVSKAIVCTGLRNEFKEHPTQYHKEMEKWLEHDLPMICANPDIVVDVGGITVWCAGALAREYKKLGGQVLMAGKPYAPIYQQALTLAEKRLGHQVMKNRVIAIGDGQPTDVKGANDADIDLLFISNGIHAEEYGVKHHPDLDRIEYFLSQNGTHAKYTMTALR